MIFAEHLPIFHHYFNHSITVFMPLQIHVLRNNQEQLIPVCQIKVSHFAPLTTEIKIPPGFVFAID